MYKLVTLEKDKYEKFVKSHMTKAHFLQSYYWGDFCRKEKNLVPYYLGLVDEKDKVVACGLLLQKKLPLGYSYFYSPRGFVLDYNDKDILKIMTDEIVKFAKKNKAIYIKIDPDVKLHDLDLDGNIIGEADNMELVNYLEKIGYKHLGFNKAFEHSQPRYTFRLELNKTMEDVKNNFHNTTKKVFNKGNIYGLEILKNDEKYIDDFYYTMKETAVRENISLYPKEYFLNFYKMLHEQNMSDIYIVYLNKNKTLEIIENNINKLNDDKDKLKTESKINELNNQIKKLEKLLSEVKKIDREKYPLSSIITAKYGDKVWTIHGGNSSMLRELNSNYLIYFEIIKDAIDEGYKLIDFFGTSYNPLESDPEYGIYLFKKRLGGEYTEFIGELDYITNKFVYFVFVKLVPIYRKMVKNRRKKELVHETN